LLGAVSRLREHNAQLEADIEYVRSQRNDALRGLPILERESMGAPSAGYPSRTDETDARIAARALQRANELESELVASRAALQEATERAVTLRSALENWGRHFEWCASRTSTAAEAVSCDCGLARELADRPFSFMTKEWCIAAAIREGDSEVSAGAPGAVSPAAPDALAVDCPICIADAGEGCVRLDDARPIPYPHPARLAAVVAPTAPADDRCPICNVGMVVPNADPSTGYHCTKCLSSVCYVSCEDADCCAPAAPDESANG
jgi:hypothetical protein